MQNLRHSIGLLEALLKVYPCQATKDSLSTLMDAKRDLECYGRLLVLQELVKGTIIGIAWEEVVNETR